MRTLALLALAFTVACGSPAEPPVDRAFTLSTINGQALPAFGESWTTSDGIIVIPAYYHEGTLDIGADGEVALRYTFADCETCEVVVREAAGTADGDVLTFDHIEGTAGQGVAEVVNRNDTMGFQED